MLKPGNGKTKSGYLWGYAADVPPSHIDPDPDHLDMGLLNEIMVYADGDANSRSTVPPDQQKIPPDRLIRIAHAICHAA